MATVISSTIKYKQKTGICCLPEPGIIPMKMVFEGLKAQVYLSSQFNLRNTIKICDGRFCKVQDDIKQERKAKLHAEAQTS